MKSNRRSSALRERADRSGFERCRGFGFAAPWIALAWIALAAALLQGSARAEGPAAKEPARRAQGPNVLFLISDQHNAKFLGCGGIVPVKTPNLDRLAREGVRFTSAVTNDPICTPSRTSYFSGQYVHNHGYYGLSGPSPGPLPNVLGHFRAAGYKTAAIGKIHCPMGWIEKDSDVFREVYGGHQRRSALRLRRLSPQARPGEFARRHSSGGRWAAFRAFPISIRSNIGASKRRCSSSTRAGNSRGSCR